MVRLRQGQRSVFEPLLPDASKLWPDDLKRIDALLEDERLLEPIVRALESRWPQSRRRGRPGTPAEVVLRLLLLKHLYRWSYDTLEREVRPNLVYRAFARIGCEAVPDAKTILKIARALGGEVIRDLHQRVVGLAIDQGVVRGRRLRIDTTVVETHVHYPTDSSLLADGVRVLTRTMQHAGALLGGAATRVRNRLRSTARCTISILRYSRSMKERPQMTQSYRRLLSISHRVVRDAEQQVRRIRRALGQAGPAVESLLRRAQARLEAFCPLLRRVISQTRQRILGGDTHVRDKVLSLFEPHTEAIRKGKLDRPTEFGKLVTIQETENQIVSFYEVHAERPSDQSLWAPALERHQRLFGRAPYLAAADRGFASAANEQTARSCGVRRIVLPRAGPKSETRRAHERQRWFRRGQRWRVGSEGRISVLKRRHGLDRCRYHGLEGMQRWVGLGVIADNLVNIARGMRSRRP